MSKDKNNDCIIHFNDTYRYSKGEGEIWLDNVNCTSSELMLSSCSHNPYGANNCDHSKDVAVSCRGKQFHKQCVAMYF